MKKTLKVFIWISVIIVLSAALLAITLFKEKTIEKEIYNSVIEDFDTVCRYVEENEKHYITISEYEIAKLSEENQSFLIERYGEFQDSRNIVFLKSYDARASYNSNTNKAEVRYYLNPAPSYHIQIIYSDDFTINSKEDETYRIVSDDICVILFVTSK